MRPPRAVVLTGDSVLLEPAGPEHAEELWPTVGADVFRYMPIPVDGPDDLAALLRRNADLAARGLALPFVQRARATGALVGHTGYWAIATEHQRLEVGMTWLTAAARRTAVNTEAKLLLLGHAFDDLGARRVEFKTDARNAGSRTALARLGAREEGTLRAHMLLTDGSWRDSVYYSLLRDEWPAVRARLRARLAQPPG